jgi:hypothetical protein
VNLIIPAANSFLWNPGLTSLGGPSGAGINATGGSRTQYGSTLTPVGQQAVINASVTGTTLTVNSVTSGTVAVGQTVVLTNAAPNNGANGVNPNIVSVILSGSGSTWTLKNGWGLLGGNITSRTMYCYGADDAQIITAIGSASAGQYVFLGAGTFCLTNAQNPPIISTSGVTLRGSGAGTTIIYKTNGVSPRSSTQVANTSPPIYVPVDQSTYSYDVAPCIIVGPSRYPGPDNNASQNLTADAAQGGMSVTIQNAAGYAAGQFVLIDELPNATWQLTPPYFTNNGATYDPSNRVLQWQGDRFLEHMHLPVQTFIDTCGFSDSNAPYDSGYQTSWTGSIAPSGDGLTGTMTVTGGGTPVIGQQLFGTGIAPFTYILNGSGSTWQVGPSQTVASTTITGYNTAEASYFSRVYRFTCEIKEIASVNGNTITFTSPLSISYRVSHYAQLTQYTRAVDGSHPSVHVQNIGVEALTLIGGGDGNLRFENAAYSWAKNIENTQWVGEGIAFNGSFRIEARASYIYTGSWPEPGGAGYCLSHANGSSETLIENCISRDADKVMVFRACGAGSVVGYVYADDGWIATDPTFVEAGINASHLCGPHHVMFEGCQSFKADADFTHGGSNYITFFRNWLTGKRLSFTDTDAAGYGNIVGASVGPGSWWYAYVGNVMGRSGQMSGWNYTDPAMTCNGSGNNCTGQSGSWSDQDIWRMGRDPSTGASNAYPDPMVLSTMYRNGNYDFLTNSQQWHNPPSPISLFTIPNSMYLSNKPTFFGTNTWPWVNPTNGNTYTLPAQAAFANAGSVNPATVLT